MPKSAGPAASAPKNLLSTGNKVDEVYQVDEVDFDPKRIGGCHSPHPNIKLINFINCINLPILPASFYLCGPMRVFTDLSQLPAFRNTVVTIGSFDGVHSGHQRILEQLKTLASSCGGESVVITFDPHPRTVLQPGDTGFKLLTTTTEKVSLLEKYGIDCVVVVPFSQEFARQSASRYVEAFLMEKFRS